MPDGTDLGGVPSDLQSTLDANPSTREQWRQLVRKAAAAWEFYADIQLVEVADDGSRLSVSGLQQNDPRFGDIRIGGYSQSMSQLAFAFAPPPFNGGTDAGDIFFNTSQVWKTDGSPYDFYTVMVHEFGHALGLGHATTSTSMMYPVYNWTKRSFASDDRNGIKAIYDAPQKDVFDAAASNNSSTEASDITSLIDAQGQINLGSLTTHSAYDSDWYQVTVPSDTTGTMTVRMQATALSSQIPGLQVWNATATTLMASDLSQTDYSSTATVTLTGLTPGEVYKIRATPNTTAPGAVGAYALLVNFGPGEQPVFPPPDTTVPSQPNQNPMTYPQGVGWRINRQFVPFAGDLGGSNEFAPYSRRWRHDDEGLYRIHIGQNNAYGDILWAPDTDTNAPGQLDFLTDRPILSWADVEVVPLLPWTETWGDTSLDGQSAEASRRPWWSDRDAVIASVDEIVGDEAIA
jgi:hypothetical protein